MADHNDNSSYFPQGSPFLGPPNFSGIPTRRHNRYGPTTSWAGTGSQSIASPSSSRLPRSRVGSFNHAHHSSYPEAQDVSIRPFTGTEPESMSIEFYDDPAQESGDGNEQGQSEGYANPYQGPIILDDPNIERPFVHDSKEAGYSLPGAGQRSAGQRFVGGFMATLTRPLKAVTKSSLFDRGATRKGAPGTTHPTGNSHFVSAPAYDGDLGAHPYPPTGTLGALPPTEVPVSPSQGPSRRISLSQSAIHANLQLQSPMSVGTAQDSQRFIPEEEIQANPEFTSDYKCKEPPPGPPDDSLSAHINRTRNFFTELKNLPWVSDRVADDYQPAKSSRARTGKQRESGSWYHSRKSDLDLLAPGPEPPRRQSLRSPAPSTTASRPTSHAHRNMTNILTSPGGTSITYYLPPGQTIHVYPSPTTTPLQPVAEGSQAPSSPLPQHLTPSHVYYAIPMPSPPPMVVAQPQRNHVRATSPTSPPTQRSSGTARHSGSNTH